MTENERGRPAAFFVFRDEGKRHYSLARVARVVLPEADTKELTRGGAAR